MKQEIASVTGRAVRETTSELEAGAGSLVYAALTGVMIQVFMLNSHADPDAKTRDAPLDSRAIERGEDDGLRITPPRDG